MPYPVVKDQRWQSPALYRAIRKYVTGSPKVGKWELLPESVDGQTSPNRIKVSVPPVAQLTKLR